MDAQTAYPQTGVLKIGIKQSDKRIIDEIRGIFAVRSKLIFHYECSSVGHELENCSYGPLSYRSM